MAYQVTKKAWLGSLLVFALGPFGFLYYSWKKAAVTFLLLLVPNMLLYALDGKLAEAIRWLVQFMMASIAYLDLKDKLFLVDELFPKLLNVISIPIFLLNVFGGGIGGIWLLILGEWKVVIGAFIFTILIPFAFSILLLVDIPMGAAMVYAAQNGKKSLWTLIGFFGMLISHIIIVCYILFVFRTSLRIAILEDVNIYACLLFGYSVATSPFIYMAQKDDPESLASTLAVIVAQISYIIFAISYLAGLPLISIPLILLIVFAIELFQSYMVSQTWHSLQDIYEQNVRLAGL